MRIVLLILFLIIIQTVSLDFRNGLFDRDKRANPPTGPPIKQILERHLPLGRVFNALYLQMELADKKIDGLDVVAGVFNLKDKASLEKLVSLKVDGLAGELKTLDEAVKKVSVGIGQLADVDLINEKYKVVLGIEEKMRKSMLDATKKDNVPQLNNPKADYVVFGNLATNPVEEMLKALQTIEKAGSDDISAKELNILNNGMRNCLEISEGLPKTITFLLKDSEKTLDVLVHGAKIASSIAQKRNDIMSFHDVISKTVTELAKLKSMTSTISVPTINQVLKSVKDVLHQVRQFPVTPSISSAFVSKHNMSQTKKDLENRWLADVLNNGSSLKILDGQLSEFMSVSVKIGKLSQHAKAPLLNDQTNTLGLISLFIEEIESYHSSSESINFPLLVSCLKIPETTETILINDIDDLSAKSKSLHSSAKSIQDTFHGATDLTKTIEDLRGNQGKYEGFRKKFPEFKKWKEENGPVQLKAFLEKLNPFFQSLKQDPLIVDFVEHLKDADKLITRVQKWISGFQFINPECKPIFSFDFEKLSPLNEIPETASKIKSKDQIKELQNLIDTIPKLQAGLRTLNPPVASATPKTPAKSPSKVNATKPPKTKRSADAQKLNLNRKDLLDVAFATRSLELMSKIEEMGVDLHMVFNRGDLVMPSAKKIKSLERKKMIEDAWQEFPAFKTDLEEFQKTNKKSLSSLKSTPEKNLEEVGKVYKDLEVFKFSKQDQLRKMRETLRFLDHPQPDLEKALENLEEPLSLDWRLVHVNFKRMPIVLSDLQKEFMQLFASDDEKESGGKGGNDNGKLILFAGIGAGAFLLLMFLVCCILYCVLVFDMDMKRAPPKEKIYTAPPEEDYQYTYMQLQDARLDINKRAKKPCSDTPLYEAMVKGDWNKFEELVKKGAVLDACCHGPMCRTVIFELVLLKKRKYCKLVLEAGANQTIWDSNGEDADTWSDHNMMTDIFQKHYDQRKEKEPPRILPKVPRYWKVLVFDKKCFKFYKKKRLPKRIKKHITWGYKPGMEFNQFSHIVLPDKYLESDDTLRLDDKDLMTFKLYGCWANLMSVDWLHAMADKKIHEEAMDMDYKYYVKHTWYRGSTHENTVTQQKTVIHKLQPGLLTNIVIYLLPSSNDKFRNEQKEDIEEIIKQFDGENVPKPDLHGTINRQMPYYAVDRIDGLANQNRSWILKYADSKIDPKWRDDAFLVTLSDIQLLYECLARWEMLNFYNEIVKADYDKKKDDDMHGPIYESRMKSLEAEKKGVSNMSRLKEGGKSRMKKSKKA